MERCIGVTDGVQDFTQPNDLNAIGCVDKYQASSFELFVPPFLKYSHEVELKQNCIVIIGIS
jgi:hypothetical protein